MKYWIRLLVAGVLSMVNLSAQVAMTHSLRPQFEQWMQPRDQGRRNTCNAFSIAQIIEYEKHLKGEHVQLSPEFLYWAAGQHLNDSRNRDGYSSRTILDAIGKYGVCSEALMPYGQRTSPSKESLADAHARRQFVVKMLTRPCAYAGVGTGFTQPEIDNICRSIEAGHPVVVDMQSPDRPKLDAHKIMQLADNRSTRNLGHTMVATGYRVEGKEGVIEFINTFGRSFGDQGYVYITFEYLRLKGAQAFCIELP